MLDVNGELMLPVYVLLEPDTEPVTNEPDTEPVRYVSGNSYLSQPGITEITNPVPTKLLICFMKYLLFTVINLIFI